MTFSIQSFILDECKEKEMSLLFFLTVLGPSEVEEDPQPSTEEQQNKSTSKKRKSEKPTQENTKKKKRKKTDQVTYLLRLILLSV